MLPTRALRLAITAGRSALAPVCSPAAMSRGANAWQQAQQQGNSWPLCRLTAANLATM